MPSSKQQKITLDNSGDNTGTMAGNIEGDAINDNSQNVFINTAMINPENKAKNYIR